MLAAIYRGGKIVQCSDFTKSSLEMQNHIQAKHIDKTTEETRPGEEGLLAKPNKVAGLLFITSGIPVFDLMGFQNRICWTP